MRIAWVVADNTVLDHDVDIERLKNIGSIWGSYRTWRGCGTDNAVCSDPGRARELLQRNFQQLCNFYVPEEIYIDLDRPQGVKLFGGKFNTEVDHPDEIIAMHLAASQNDIILLLGFDWQDVEKNSDKLLEHRAHVYRHLVRQVIVDNPTVQWVLIDHSAEYRKDLQNLDNLTKDTLKNAVDMF